MAGEALVRQFLDHAERLAGARIADLVADDPGRTAAMALRVGPVYASFARQRIDAPTLATLGGLAGHVRLSLALRALVDGAEVNVSERRPALHTALRSGIGRGDVARAAHADALAARERMAALSDLLSAKEEVARSSAPATETLDDVKIEDDLAQRRQRLSK